MTILSSIQPLLNFLLDDDCSYAFLTATLVDPRCKYLLLSKLVGYSIVLSGLFLKVPQVLDLFRFGKHQGLNIPVLLFESLGLKIIVAHNHSISLPFSTYGEAVFIYLQDIILIFSILYYRNNTNFLFFGLLVYAYISYYILDLYSSSSAILSRAVEIVAPILTFLIVPQIWFNFRYPNLIGISAKTAGLGLLIACGRLITTLIEVDSTFYLANAFAAAFFESCLLLASLDP